MQHLSYLHRGGDTPLIGSTIGAFVADVAARHPDRDAVVALEQDRRLTYAALLEEADAVARGLLAIGLGHGDRVALLAENCAEWVVLQLAAARIGAVLVNVNPGYRAEELVHALRCAKAQALVHVPRFRRSDYVAMVADACPEVATCAPDALRVPALPDLRRLVVLDPDDPMGTSRPAPGYLTWPELIEHGRTIPADRFEAALALPDADDPIDIQFTSGTTGRPRAVVLTHHGILNNGFYVGAALGFTETDRLCVPVPFHHCFGMVVATLACLTHGSTVVIPSAHFDADAALAAIEAERCTAVHGVPTMFIAMLESPDFGSRDLSTLRTGVMAGAPCPPELMRRVIGDMGCRDILIGYGMTESSPVTHLTRPGDSIERRTRTVGTNTPHTEVKVVDPETHRTLPLDEPGEVCFRGYHVMRGYLDDPDATAAAIDRTGWLHSGDLGALDADGFLRITGRHKDMIIRGGENIFPAEIEAVYHEHPDIVQIAVFGVPDDRLGEQVGAWIQLRDGADRDDDALRAWGRERLAHYKIPQHVWFVDEFPLTASGKIQKFRIRETVAAWMREQDAVGVP